MRIFISYSHQQSDWVHSRLIPILRAAGGTALVDVDHFKAGETVMGQMDELQGAAGRHLLLVTSDYLASAYCLHEMDQAIESDPGFATGKVLPIMLDGTPLPPQLASAGGLASGLLYVDLQDDKKVAAWALLLNSCKLGLPGTDAPTWLRTLDETKTHLERGESVNLVIRNRKVNWRLWLDQLTQTRFKQIVVVDLEHPRAVPRNGLISEILKATGRSNSDVPPPPR